MIDSEKYLWRLLLDVIGSAYYGPSDDASPGETSGSTLSLGVRKMYQVPEEHLRMLVVARGVGVGNVDWRMERQVWPHAHLLKFDASNGVCYHNFLTASICLFKLPHV